MPTAFDVAREWGGKLRPVIFAAPKPLLPAATISFLHYAGTPKRFRVEAYEQMRIEFSSAPVNLAEVWESEIKEWAFPSGWNRFWRIGEVTHAQANAWLCIEELTGHVVAVYIGNDEPIAPVNTSVERLVRCMKVFLDWFQSTKGSMEHAVDLQTALSDHAVLANGEADAFWLPFVAAAVEEGCDRLTVGCND